MIGNTNVEARSSPTNISYLLHIVSKERKNICSKYILV
jgi:hypothetical protein